MTLASTLASCQSLTDQGRFVEALALLKAQVLPELVTAGENSHAMHAQGKDQLEQEMRHCQALLRQLVVSAKRQQQNIRQQLQDQRQKGQSRSAYTATAAIPSS